MAQLPPWAPEQVSLSQLPVPVQQASADYASGIIPSGNTVGAKNGLVWNGTAWVSAALLTAPSGMTAQDLIVAASSTAVQRLAAGSSGQKLVVRSDGTLGYVNEVVDVTAWGVTGNGSTDDTTKMLAAVSFAQGSGMNGGNQAVVLPAGASVKMSSPIPLYNGLTLLCSDATAGIETVSAKITNTVTDIFSVPTGALTLSDLHLRGLFFQGSGPNQNTSIVTPQPVDGSGCVFQDWWLDRLGWQFFRSAFAGSFLRLHLRGFQGNNCSSTQLVLHGADSEIGMERSYIGSKLVGNQARWPTVTAGATGAWVQNNIIQIADAAGVFTHFYKANASTSTSPTVAGPYSQASWTYIGSYRPGSAPAAYSATTTYSTVGTLVTWGAQSYYLQAAPTAAGVAPPGTSTSGARTNSAYWLWVDPAYGTASGGANPSYFIEFAMAQSKLHNVYPTPCPGSAIICVGTCAHSSISGCQFNGQAIGTTDNSGNQLAGADGDMIYVNALSANQNAAVEPAGLLNIFDNAFSNYAQDSFGVHSAAVNLQDSSAIRAWANQFSNVQWTGGPAVATGRPYRIGSASQSVTDIKIWGTVYAGGTLTAYLTTSGTSLTNIECDSPAPIIYSSGTNTLPLWGTPAYLSGGTNSLPAAASVSTGLRFFVANTSGSALTLNSAGGNINGASNIAIPANSAVVCASDGTNWWAT